MSEFPYKIEQCVWELTLRCNMRCWNCSSAGAGSVRCELSVRESLRVAEQIMEQGCRQVTLIGGEVFLYEGWDRISRRLSDGGVRVNVVTNGQVSGRKLIGQLGRARPSEISVAMDGMEASHDCIRGVPGSFRRACEFIDILRGEGLPVGVVTSMPASNVGELPAMYDMLIGMGVKFWRLQSAAPATRQAAMSDSSLGRGRMLELSRFLAGKRAEGKLEIHGFDAPGCPAGLSAVGIDSAGNVRGCQALADERFIEGNLHTQTLAEIWRSPRAFSYNRGLRRRQPLSRPAGCHMGETCRSGRRGICSFAAGWPHENQCPPCQDGHVPVRLVARKPAAGRAAEQARMQENKA